MKTRHPAVLAAFAVALLIGSPARSAPAPGTAAAAEYRLKAIFLLQFAQFVRWPPETPGDELVVGTLGSDPFGDVLERALEGERVGARRVRIEHWRELGEVETCHILFIAVPDTERRGEILAALRGRSVLTVGDTPGFAEAGGIIGFFIRDDRIRFRINLRRANAAGLEISSRLLSLAEIVEPALQGETR